MDSSVKTAIETFHGQLRQAREAQQRGELAQALTTLTQAREGLAALPAEVDEVREATGAAWAEQALLAQRMQDARASRNAFDEALRLFGGLPMDAAEGRYRLQLATTLVNCSVLLARERMLEDAVARLDEALGHLDALPASQAKIAMTLRMGALQNRGSFELEAQQPEAAVATMERALALGNTLLDDGQGQWLPQVLDLHLRLSHLLRQLKRNADSLKLAERASRLAEAHRAVDAQGGARMFVAAQLQLVDGYFVEGRFAQAETELFKAVDATEDLQAMLVGTGFYLSLLRREDAALEAGDLPRDEVEESLQELVARLERAGTPGDLMEIVRARQALMVQEDATSAKAVMTRWVGQQVQAQSVLAQLLQQLASDLEYRGVRPE
jgi:hypothetical protein